MYTLYELYPVKHLSIELSLSVSQPGNLNSLRNMGFGDIS